jgi:hypothetical protein
MKSNYSRIAKAAASFSRLRGAIERAEPVRSSAFRRSSAPKTA